MNGLFQPLAMVRGIHHGRSHPLPLHQLASRAPEGTWPIEWALAACLVRGVVLLVALPRWDEAAGALVDGGPTVSAGPYHYATGDGPTWAVLDLTGAMIFGAWDAGEVAAWLAHALTFGPGLDLDGALWAGRAASRAEMDGERRYEFARSALAASLDKWLTALREDVQADREWQAMMRSSIEANLVKWGIR